jgi:oligosaccharide repeat unit polymerase
MKTIIKSYTQIWIGVYLMAFLIPANSIYKTSSRFYAIGLIMLFLTVLTTSLLLSYSFFKRKKKYNDEHRIPQINKHQILLVIKICSLLSLAGLSCFIIDKVLIQGINYAEGLAVARYDYRDIGEGRTGVSSLYSALGYILSGFSCIAFILSFVFFDQSQKWTLYGLLLPFLDLMGVSVLTGGRTSIILIVAMVLGGRVLRKLLRYEIWPFNKKNTSLFIVLLVVIFFYVIYIFADRAQQSDEAAKFYAESMIVFLSGSVNPYFDKIEILPDLIQNFIYLCISLLAYLVHSNWILEGIFELNIMYGEATFVGFRDYLSKIGLPFQHQEWSFEGKFISWPGALFHDIGLWGMIGFAIFHGILFGYCIYEIRDCMKITMFTLFLFFINFTIIITSPFICVIDILMFTPVCVSFIATTFGLLIYKNNFLYYVKK